MSIRLYVYIYVYMYVYVEMLSLKIDVDLIYIGLWLGCHVQYALHLVYTRRVTIQTESGCVIFCNSKQKPNNHLYPQSGAIVFNNIGSTAAHFSFCAPQRHSMERKRDRENKQKKAHSGKMLKSKIYTC